MQCVAAKVQSSAKSQPRRLNRRILFELAHRRNGENQRATGDSGDVTHSRHVLERDDFQSLSTTLVFQTSIKRDDILREWIHFGCVVPKNHGFRCPCRMAKSRQLSERKPFARKSHQLPLVQPCAGDAGAKAVLQKRSQPRPRNQWPQRQTWLVPRNSQFSV